MATPWENIAIAVAVIILGSCAIGIGAAWISSIIERHARQITGQDFDEGEPR